MVNSGKWLKRGGDIRHGLGWVGGECGGGGECGVGGGGVGEWPQGRKRLNSNPPPPHPTPPLSMHARRVRHFFIWREIRENLLVAFLFGKINLNYRY